MTIIRSTTSVSMRKLYYIITLIIFGLRTARTAISNSGIYIANSHPDPLQQAADEKFMLRAIKLASQSQGQTSPNPCVGCVLVDKSGTIIGEGFHLKAGHPHAEAEALHQAGILAKDTTAYVSLEPCNHFGRTPPCSHALIKAGVSRVVVGMMDPDPRVSGSGIGYLYNAGIPVTLGVSDECYQACRELNRPFVHRVQTGRSYLCLAVQPPPLNAAAAAKCSLLSALLKILPNVPECDTIIVTRHQVSSLIEVDGSLPTGKTIIIVPNIFSNSATDEDMREAVEKISRTRAIGDERIDSKVLFFQSRSEANERAAYNSDGVRVVAIEEVSLDGVLRSAAAHGSNACVLCGDLIASDWIDDAVRKNLVQRVVQFDGGDAEKYKSSD